MKNIKLIIFDLDGTLVNAYPAIGESLNYTLRKLGRPIQPPLAIRRAVGWGDKELLRPFVKQTELRRGLNIYRKHHARALIKFSRLFPGARKVLSGLKKTGYKLAVASNRPTFFSGILIRHLNIKKYFDYLLCADTLKHGKPHPEILEKIMEHFGVSREETLYVGDMGIDAQAGRRAKVRTVLVRTGSSSPAEIKKEKPFKIIKSIAGLPRVMERILPLSKL